MSEMMMTMTMMMKEALKSLCGLDRWSYAVFWKFDHRNPRLIICEDFYVEPMPHSVLLANPTTSDPGSSRPTLVTQEEYMVSLDSCSVRVGAVDRKGVELLIDKMTGANRVHVLGEGLVGRAAFSGNHQWIVAKNYIIDVQPVEVQIEIKLQFLAGMQTIAVIPTPPHGVVQFGSPSTIPEDVAFVHEVKSMILRLGSVPGSFLPKSSISRETPKIIELPASYARSASANHHWTSEKFTSGSSIAYFSDMQRSLLQSAELVTGSDNAPGCQMEDEMLTTSSTVGLDNLTQASSKSPGHLFQPKIFHQIDSILSQKSHVKNEMMVPEAVQLSQDVLLQHNSFSFNPGSGCHENQAGGIQGFSMFMGDSGRIAHGHHLLTASSKSDDFKDYLSKSSDATGRCIIEIAGTNLRDTNFLEQEIVGLNCMAHSTVNSMLSNVFSNGYYSAVENQDSCYDMKGKQNDLFDAVNVASTNAEECSSSISSVPGLSDFHSASHATAYGDLFEDVYTQSSSGDNLFDILGMDLKNKVLGANRSREGRGSYLENLIKDAPNKVPGSGCYSYDGKTSDTGDISGSGSDNLLDAIVSGVNCSSRQSSDNNESSKSTLTKVNNSPFPSVTFCGGAIQSVMQEAQVVPSEASFRLGQAGADIVGPMRGKIEAGNCSQASSLYGSDIISSWIESGSKLRQTSVASATSKNDVAGKTNRKRLKPGENPRPRPKDRQMIQDRMKELREIVPNGAKCSIDALLERTIKHMLFLQSVTKHADKLKQMVESKMINEDGGLLLRDNYDGGATWAFEVGTQSMLCPIIVEDLNPPRQLLIEMLCEERGFFLEIADIIRGLGLTILRGLMETRNDKIWARFAVEANRDVTRMEIFFPLVHMLDGIVTGNGLSPNGESNANKTGQNPVHCTVPMTANQLVGSSNVQ